MPSDKQRIFDVVKANTLKVMADLHPDEITIDKSLTDLGANSVDRVEVVMNSIEDLNLQVPLAELQGIRSLQGLVDLLHRYVQT